jgi:hypothetical protein
MLGTKPCTHAMLMTRIAYLRTAVKGCSTRMSIQKRRELINKVQKILDEVNRYSGRKIDGSGKVLEE